MKPNSAKLWQYLLLTALTGMLPMAGIVCFVIGTSVNKDIEFGSQESKGNAFQRPLEQLLDLIPRYQEAARLAVAGGPSAPADLAGIQHEIDVQIDVLKAAYQGDLGRALKFTDADLASRKRDNARLAVVLSDWETLRGAAPEIAAGGETAGRLVASFRAMIAHAGDLSNLILDSDLDSYYLMDITLCALPQTQQRLGEVTQQVSGWIRAGTAGTKQAEIAVMAAMLQQDDQDRISGDAQTSLSEDGNFHGLSPSLQKNLPPALEKYVAANQVLLGLLNRVGAGEKITVAEFEAAGWNCRAESFRLWTTSVDELDVLLAHRVESFRHNRLVSFSGIAATIILVTVVIWLIGRHLNHSLRTIIQTLGSAATQVTSSAGQLSTASQELADGSSEQAASLEETSASLEEMSSMTKRNADSAHQAKALAAQTRASADLGAKDMQAMSAAIRDIKNSSDDIAKIIRTIDEIAFQTNILALNAAVEAARAGEAGAGFAVVADEVRTLSQRSAQAARETAEKIESAIAKTSVGVQLSEKVASRLVEIVTHVRKVDDLIAEVAVASKEQGEGLAQINIAVAQMDRVTQANAANGEETASSAGQLSSHAEFMNSAVLQMRRLLGSTVTAPDGISAASTAPKPFGLRAAATVERLADAKPLVNA